ERALCRGEVPHHGPALSKEALMRRRTVRSRLCWFSVGALLGLAGCARDTEEASGASAGGGEEPSSGSTGATSSGAQGGPNGCGARPWGDVPPGGLDLPAGVWTQLSDAASGEFAIDPSNPHTIYVCRQNAGVWKTTDGGATWDVLGTGS